MTGCSAGEVVAEASMPTTGREKTEHGENAGGMVVFADYEGHRTKGSYNRKTTRIDITSGPLARQSFKTPTDPVASRRSSKSSHHASNNVTVVAVQQISGISAVFAAVLVAEIGDMRSFTSLGQLTCWAGLTRSRRNPTKRRQSADALVVPNW